MKSRILSFAVAIIAVVNAPAWGQVFQQGSMKFRLAFFDTADRGNIDWIVRSYLCTFQDGKVTAKDYARACRAGSGNLHRTISGVSA
jgi:hypothetical protein